MNDHRVNDLNQHLFIILPFCGSEAWWSWLGPLVWASRDWNQGASWAGLSPGGSGKESLSTIIHVGRILKILPTTATCLWLDPDSAFWEKLPCPMSTVPCGPSFHVIFLGHKKWEWESVSSFYCLLSAGVSLGHPKLFFQLEQLKEFLVLAYVSL